MTGRRLALAVAAAVVTLDQLTKWWAVNALDDGPIEILGEFLRLRLVFNPGGAFNSLQNAGVLLGVVAIGAVLILVRLSGSAADNREAVVFGLILGGAAGNLIDRIFRADGFLDGKVVDWISFDFFPTFNVADSAVTIGAILAILIALFQKQAPVESRE